MHRAILGARLVGAVALQVAVAAAAASEGPPATAPAAAAPCPPRQAPVTEHYLGADCPECWAAPAATAPAARLPGGWRLDWIVPAASGDAAALAAAATPEAQARLERAGLAAPGPAQTLVLRDTAQPPAGVRMTVETGPAWAGYLGVRLRVSGHLPAGTQAWIALVERLEPGGEGLAQARELVRHVAGPLPLHAGQAPARSEHLRALRWPEQALPHRLQARAWLELPGARLAGMASVECPLR